MCGGGMVATATMAEVGFFDEFMAWVKRMPVWSIPSKPTVHIQSYAEYTSILGLHSLATIYYGKKAIENLRANMPFIAMMEPRNIPEANKEKSIQMIRFVQNAFEL
jgi:hypothetical protein